MLRGVLTAVLLWCSASIHAEQYAIPLFVAAGPGGDPQGVLRLVSDAETAATVAIHAIDDSGARIGPATLTLDAMTAMDFSATELQSGSAAKGLSAGLGSLAGEVRLSIDSDVPVVPSAYVRNAEGTLSAMNATVLEAAGAGQAIGSGRNAFHYDVAVFHPASNAMQPSRLRLINPGDAGLLRLDYDAGLSCEARFHFGSRRSGWYAFACVNAEDRVEIWTGGTWQF